MANCINIPIDFIEFWVLNLIHVTQNTFIVILYFWLKNERCLAIYIYIYLGSLQFRLWAFGIYKYKRVLVLQNGTSNRQRLKEQNKKRVIDKKNRVIEVKKNFKMLRMQNRCIDLYHTSYFSRKFQAWYIDLSFFYIILFTSVILILLFRSISCLYRDINNHW